MKCYYSHESLADGNEGAVVRIAVAGGTGLVGRQTVKALRRSGHDAVVIARSVGVDLTTGDGLAAALVGVDAVVDVLNTPTVDPGEARESFATTTRQLLAAEHNASVIPEGAGTVKSLRRRSLGVSAFPS
jgi:uncharacterized protein YbjT (DUF2867 family)